MDFLSKQIGVSIMEKFKIYIHHYYTYELFWYFCHGVDIDSYDVPVWFRCKDESDNRNRFNKNVVIEENVSINANYKGTDVEFIFCNKKHWEKNDGYHLFDYSSDLLEKGLTSDNGFISPLRNETNIRHLKMLNRASMLNPSKIHYMYLDWEGHNPYVDENWSTALKPDVVTFVDETTSPKSNGNSKFSFTNLLWSFVSPNTLHIRDYYFFADYLKYKNDYKYKINVPIRRLYGEKINVVKKALELKNPYITSTVSSFGTTNQFGLDVLDTNGNWSDNLIKLINTLPKENFIEKRGYGIHDWGGEWNANSMNENMWRMFGISEVVIQSEVYPISDNLNGKTPGQNWITEKTISHILVGKPFIPYNRGSLDIYEKYMKEYDKELSEFPIKYTHVLDIFDYLDKVTQNETEWKELVFKLQKYVFQLRKGIVEIMHENNSYLDYVISKEPIKKPKLI